MTHKIILESNMTFGPYESESCFHIEECNSYHKIKEGVKIAEFLLLRKQERGITAWIVEAKSSSPTPENQEDFGKYINEIKQKLINGFLLSIAMRLQRHSDAEADLPQTFKDLDLCSLEFRFVLVINGHKLAWLPPLQDALASELKPIVKTWGLPANSVTVVNHIIAREYGFISK